MFESAALETDLVLAPPRPNDLEHGFFDFAHGSHVRFGRPLQDLSCSLQLLQGVVWIGLDTNVEEVLALATDLREL